MQRCRDAEWSMAFEEEATVASVMRGFPPAREGQVTLANWRSPPFHRWAFQHVRELIPTVEIANDPGAVWALCSAPIDTKDVRIERGGAAPLSFDAFLAETSTDAIAILYRGRIAYECYRNGMGPDTPHILMSVSKSILGLLAGALVARGMLDPDALVTSIIPELGETAYAGASIRQLLDMRTGVAFDEDYLATSGDIVTYRQATGWNPVSPGQPVSDLRSFYQEMRRTRGAHGGVFDYISPNTDLLGWVLERVAGKRYADLISELIWRPIGASTPAYITVDRLGAPRCAGGMCATVMDLARVGQLIVNGGARGGRQILAAEWIDDITEGGDPDAWDTGSLAHYFANIPLHYRNQWYVLRDQPPLLMALGIHGQYLFVDQTREIVIAKTSSQDLPLDAQQIAMTLQAVSQIREWITRA